MGSREVQARWLKTQATDVSGTLQSGAPASASAGHDALLRWCPPGTWRWHHMPSPPGPMQSRGWHFGSHLPAQTQLPVWWRAPGETAHMLNTDLKGTKLGHVHFVNLASWMRSEEAGNVLVKHCNAFPLLLCLYIEKDISRCEYFSPTDRIYALNRFYFLTWLVTACLSLQHSAVVQAILCFVLRAEGRWMEIRWRTTTI